VKQTAPRSPFRIEKEAREQGSQSLEKGGWNRKGIRHFDKAHFDKLSATDESKRKQIPCYLLKSQKL
jgi:hypothetical protein